MVSSFNFNEDGKLELIEMARVTLPQSVSAKSGDILLYQTCK